MKRKWKQAVLVAAAVFFAVVLLDTLGVFDRRPYFEVPHGSHTHYVAKDRDPDVSISQFPTRPPGPNERITPQGQMVPK